MVVNQKGVKVSDTINFIEKIEPGKKPFNFSFVVIKKEQRLKGK